MQSKNHLMLAGLNCPLPVLRVKKALAHLASKEILEVIVTDPHAPNDLAAFCHQTGHILLACEKNTPQSYRIILQKK
jgi:TusA-related sulfurtransferase